MIFVRRIRRSIPFFFFFIYCSIPMVYKYYLLPYLFLPSDVSLLSCPSATLLCLALFPFNSPPTQSSTIMNAVRSSFSSSNPEKPRREIKQATVHWTKFNQRVLLIVDWDV